MASFSHISGAEPSTVTFKLATVSQTRNSSLMHQEIMALGDPDTSNALAAVLNAVPASTAWGLVVRQVGNSSIQGNSTVFQGTSPWIVSGASTVAQASTVWAVQMSQYSTTVNVSSVGGTVTIAGNSTVAPASGSTWRTQPGSTLWASSAGFHFDSSGALQITGATSSTQVAVSSVGGKVLVSPNSTTPEPAFSVRISDGSTWVTDYLQGSTFTSTAVAGGADFLRAGASSVSSSDTFVMPWGSTFGAQYIIPVTDSGASVMDSTNGAIKVNVVAGSAASTTVQVSSVAGRVATMPNSTLWASSAGFHFDSSGALHTVASFTGSTTVQVSSVAGRVGTMPSDTNWASSAGFHFTSSGELQVNASFSGSTIVTVSTGSVRVHQSTAADLNATVTQASTTWAVQLSQYSTTVNVSSLGGTVTIQGNSTVSIGTNLQSSVAPSSGSSGLIVRQVIDTLITFASTSALASTTVAVASSVASVSAYVTAYSITSTNQTAAHWGFFSSNGTLLWPITLAALSSGVAGANLAVAPPGYLFKTVASDALNFKTAGSTVAGVQIGVSYFRAP